MMGRPKIRNIDLRRRIVDFHELGYEYDSNFEAPDIPIGGLVRLRASARTENLFGNGFMIFASAYDFEGNLLFGIDTFQETARVRGTTDWTEYTTNIGSFPAGVEQLQIILAIGANTVGNVYFDDYVVPGTESDWARTLLPVRGADELEAMGLAVLARIPRHRS